MVVNHILPLNDIIDHIEQDDCPCDPEVKFCEDDHKLVIHNAMDRREVFEQRDSFNNQNCTPCVDTKCNSCGVLINECECLDLDGKSVWKWRK